MKIAGQHDVGLKFIYEGEELEIIEFRPRANVNPFIAQITKTGEKVLLPITDYILKQIRNGLVTEIK